MNPSFINRQLSGESMSEISKVLPSIAVAIKRRNTGSFHPHVIDVLGIRSPDAPPQHQISAYDILNQETGYHEHLWPLDARKISL